MYPYVGEIIMVPYGRGVPSGFLRCDGATYSVSEYEVLYNLIGTTYGGDGYSFAVPDLRSRVPVHQGTGQGLSSYQQGQQFGVESVTLTTAQMPSHSHPLAVSSAVASTTSPVGAVPAVLAQDLAYGSPGEAAGPDGRPDLASAGASLPHPNLSPTLAIHFAIAWEGIYPPQS